MKTSPECPARKVGRYFEVSLRELEKVDGSMDESIHDYR